MTVWALFLFVKNLFESIFWFSILTSFDLFKFEIDADFEEAVDDDDEVEKQEDSFSVVLILVNVVNSEFMPVTELADEVETTCDFLTSTFSSAWKWDDAEEAEDDEAISLRLSVFVVSLWAIGGVGVITHISDSSPVGET